MMQDGKSPERFSLERVLSERETSQTLARGGQPKTHPLGFRLPGIIDLSPVATEADLAEMFGLTEPSGDTREHSN